MNVIYKIYHNSAFVYTYLMSILSKATIKIILM